MADSDSIDSIDSKEKQDVKFFCWQHLLWEIPSKQGSDENAVVGMADMLTWP